LKQKKRGLFCLKYLKYFCVLSEALGAARLFQFGIAKPLKASMSFDVERASLVLALNKFDGKDLLFRF